MLKGSALVAALIGFLATCAALIALVGLGLAGSNKPLPSGTVYQSPPLHLWRADMVVVAVRRASRDISEDAAP